MATEIPSATFSSRDNAEATMRLELRLAEENPDTDAAVIAIKEFRKLRLDEADGDLVLNLELALQILPRLQNV
ncbi:unnamed protein product [Clavelina lepadiformis]|uniref:Uncharacterized protein n=1 Tax=Clavelina lepadiformis TaxID=159417 RepID=A0ABP0F3P6_CLALP